MLKLPPLPYYWQSINPISVLLLPLAGLFCVLVALRRWLYRLGWLASYRAPLPVVIVGNISVGGTGKTPLIIHLVKWLQDQGRKPGVISRGYGGNSSYYPRLLDERASARQVGDEPRLIYQQTNCPVVVGADRKADIELLLAQTDCDIILADDGMQHYALQRDREIAVIDAQRGFGNGFCLPSGPLREPVSRLKAVDMVIVNGGGREQSAFVLQPCDQLSAVGSNAGSLGNSPTLDSLKGKTVHAVAGIGHPPRFFSLLESWHITVIPHAFDDHYQYAQHELEFNDGLPVLMTGKDAVKCQHMELTDHWSVDIELELSTHAQQQLARVFDGL